MPNKLTTTCPDCNGHGYTLEGADGSEPCTCDDGQVPMMVSVVVQDGEDLMVFASRRAAVDHVYEFDLNKHMEAMNRAAVKRYLESDEWPLCEVTREDGEPIKIESCEVMG